VPVSPAKSDGESKSRKRNRRLRIFLLAALLIAAIVRLSMQLLLPFVANRVAAVDGLNCDYDRMTLSVLGGTAYFWNLQLRPKDGGDAILRADYIQGYISPANLLRGRLVVWRAEADGVDLTLERTADGSIPLLARFMARAQSAGSPATTGAAPGKPIDLQAPLRVDAVRLTHVNVHFRDLSVTPNFQAQVQATVRVSNIGNAATPVQLEVEVFADPILDSMQISGTIHNTATSIEADMRLLVLGLHPKPAAVYLLPIGLQPIADDVAVRGGMKLSVRAHSASPDISAKFSLSDIIATVDDRPCASLKTLSLEASALNASTLKLDRLLFEHGVASIERSAQGPLQFAGVEIVPAPPGSAPAATSKPTAHAAPAGNPWAFLNPPAINAELGEIRLSDVKLSLTDQTFVPAIVTSASLDVLRVKNLVLDPSRAGTPVTIDGKMSVPGIIRAITIKGQATPVAATKKLALAVTAAGIRPDAARPYLDRLGIDSQFVDGSMTGQLDADASVDAGGSLSADASISNVALMDQGQSLATMAKFAVSARLGPASVRIHELDVDGPELAVRRDAQRGMNALGLRLRSLAPIAAAPAARADRAASPLGQLPALLARLQSISLPAISIDKSKWNSHVNFVDETGVLDRPVEFALSGELHNAQYAPHAPSDKTPPGEFSAMISAPGLADQIFTYGEIRQLDGGLGLKAFIKARGITGRVIAPYLKKFGVEPTMSDGRIDSRIDFFVWPRAEEHNATNVWLQFGATTLTDGAGTALASMDGAEIGIVTLRPTGIAVDGAGISAPKLHVQRNHDGTFAAFGLRFALPPSSSSQATAVDPPLSLHLPTLPIALKIGSLAMRNGELDWTDNVPAPTVSIRGQASVSLNGVDLSAGAPPAKLHVSAKIVDAIDSATADGTVSCAPDLPAIDLTVDASGIRAGPIAAYMPNGLSSTFKQGHFAVGIRASAKNNPAGGIAARFAVHDLTLTDRSPATDWAHVGQFTMSASRLDPAHDVIAFDEISSSGVSATVRRLPDGGIEAGGLRLQSSNPTIVPAWSKSVEAIKAGPAAPATQSAVNVAQLVAAARRPFPQISIDRLDLEMDRFAIEGAVDPNGAPLVLAKLRLHSPGPIVIGGPKAAARPAVQLAVDGALEPITGHFAASLSALPFAPEPSLKMDVKAEGISGQGIIDVMPELGAVMKGKELTAGTLTTHVYVSANYQRRGPRDFDLSRGFVATLGVSPLQYRQTPDGPVIAGFESLHAEGIVVKPMIGDVRMKLIELTTPIGRFYRDKEGIHALGMVIPLETESSKPMASKEKIHSEAKPATATAAAAHHAPPIRPTSEIRLDRFTISGVDMIVEDRTTTPTTEIPLKTLDVEINDVSNQMPWTQKQARFSVLCTSDKVWLPPRQGETSSATTRTASGQYLEQRDLFSEITATGKIGIRYRSDGTPVLDGWAKTAVDGFELLGVRGIAEQMKVKFGGGVFDDTNDIRFEPDGIKTQNQVVLTNLSLSEPANGPLQSTFKLPVPIDVAIGVVTDADGSITLNLPVNIKNGEISWSDVYLPAVGAVGGVLGTAVASAPVKAVNDVLDIFGGGKKAGTNAPQTIRIPFVAGYADLLDPSELQIVAGIAEKMNADPHLQLQISHELSGADAARAAVRANPSAEECLFLTDRLRRQKARLLARRAELAAQARGEIPSQSPAVSSTLAELREVDRSLAGIESSLDQLYDLLRPGAAAQASRRTRAASLDLGRARMSALRDAIAGGDHGLLDRIHMTVAQSTVSPSASTDPQAGGSVVLTLISKRH
jgi:hypothetical protein